MTFDELDRTVHRWLYIVDPGYVKVLTASVIANQLPGDPLWLLMVAAPGGAKTELLRGLELVPDIHLISDLTTQTFMSGLKEKGAGLLERLGPYSILIMKDFTTVLTMNKDKRHEIMSQLREIYDGYYRRELGNGVSRQWDGKLGFIAAVTSIIDLHQGVYQTLGERFVQYRPEQPDELLVTERALSNQGKEKQMREEIQSAFLKYLQSVNIPAEPLEIPAQYQKRILHLAAFCAKARSGVIRDSSGNHDIKFVPESEIPTRLVKQFSTLFRALAIISGGFTEDDYIIIYKVALDSLSTSGRKIIEYMVEIDQPVKPPEVASAVGDPVNTIRRRLEDFEALRITTSDDQGAGLPTYYKLSDKARKQLTLAKPHMETLPEKSADLIQQIFGASEVVAGDDIPAFPDDTQI